MGDFVEIGWARSATGHRISKSRSLYVVQRAACFFEEDPPPGLSGGDVRLWFFGDDPERVPLEVIGVEASERQLVVIHAMQLRARHRDDYEEVRRWQERKRDIR